MSAIDSVCCVGCTEGSRQLILCLVRPMRFFPSIPAAAISGAVVVPVFTHGSRVITQHTDSSLIQFFWAVIGFLITVASIGDFSHIAEDWRRGSLFSWRSIGRDFSEKRFGRIVVPSWIRVGVWFASFVASFVVLKVLRFEF